MTGDILLAMMARDLRAGMKVDDVVDRYCTCSTPELRQKIIDRIRIIVGYDMINKAMKNN